MKPIRTNRDLPIVLKRHLEACIRDVAIRGTVDWNWKFRFKGIGSGEGYGWLVWAEFTRPEIRSLQSGIGRTRQEFIPSGAYPSAVVKTLYVILDLTVRHELMEGFIYRGAQPFNPHHTIDELAAIRGPLFHKGIVEEEAS